MLWHQNGVRTTALTPAFLFGCFTDEHRHKIPQ
jgi:hypothetical protein